MIDNNPLAIGLAVAITLTLVWAAFSDIKARIIPNRAVLALLVLFVAWTGVSLGQSLFSALAAAGIAFAVTVALYLFKIVGAGDSKLFTAVALFVGLGYLPFFALATVLAGGVIALISLVCRPQRAAVMLTLGGKGDWGRGVPYGVAIAVGGFVVIWAALSGYLAPYRYGKPAVLSSHELLRGLSAPGAR